VPSRPHEPRDLWYLAAIAHASRGIAHESTLAGRCMGLRVCDCAKFRKCSELDAPQSYGPGQEQTFVGAWNHSITRPLSGRIRVADDEPSVITAGDNASIRRGKADGTHGSPVGRPLCCLHRISGE
jgi:hypothetical protein